MTVARPEAPPVRRTSAYRPDIEGLRAVAVVLVVADHAWGIPAGGFVGVDVFFVISGYLITRALVRDQEERHGLRLGRFYLRRVARLFPAAALVIVVTAVVSALLYFRVTAIPLLMQALASLFWVQNWALVHAGTDYLNPSDAVSPFQHFWSLSLEEQFYAFWPWLLLGAWFLAGRIRRRTTPRTVLVIVTTTMVVVSLSASVWLTDTLPSAAYFLPFTRVWEFGIGTLLACGTGSALPRRLVVLLRMLGLGAILVSAFAFGPATPFPGAAALLPVLGAAAVIGATDRSSRGDPVGALLTAAPVRYLGRISYSLYLWHAPVIIIAAAVAGQGAGVAFLVVLVSVVLAAVTYHFVENPARNAAVWKRAQVFVGDRRAWTRVLGILCTAVLVAVLSFVQWRGMVPSFLDADRSSTADASGSPAFATDAQLGAALQQATSTPTWGPLGRQFSAPTLPRAHQMDCLRDPVGLDRSGRIAAADACTAGPSQGRLALVIGDSIAMSWMPSVQAALVPDGWRVSGLGLESCPAAQVSVAERRARPAFPAACEQARAADLESALAMEPDLIILSSAEGSLDRLTSGAGGDAAVAEWRTGLQSTIGALAVLDRPIAVLSNPPEGVSPGGCATRLNGPADCVSSPSVTYRDKASAERDAVGASAASGIRVAYVDAENWFCVDRKECPLVAAGTLIRVDGGHLTEQFSERLGLVMRRALDDGLLGRHVAAP